LSHTPPPTNKPKQAAKKETKPAVFTGWDSMMSSSFGANAVTGVAKELLEKPEKAKNDSKPEAQPEGKKGKNKKNAANEATKKAAQEATKAQEK